MNQRLEKIDVLSIITILILATVSIAGVLSVDFSKSYEVVNQYGDVVKIYGNGIYAHDSYFKAPISIGTDFTIFLVVVPLFIWSFVQNRKNHTSITELNLLSIYSVVLYYAASLSFGVTYNSFHLLYIALFSCTLFGVFSLIRKIDTKKLGIEATKGISIFLIMAGVSLIVAWMPDIIPTIFTGESLSLIEVYTTEITYVLDIGIIGPLCLVCLYLLKKKDGLGIVLLAVLLKCSIVVGIMMISETIFQMVSGYEAALPVLITKSGSFVFHGGFALYFYHKLIVHNYKHK
jgi:hypothetical protein